MRITIEVNGMKIEQEYSNNIKFTKENFIDLFNGLTSSVVQQIEAKFDLEERLNIPNHTRYNITTDHEPLPVKRLSEKDIEDLQGNGTINETELIVLKYLTGILDPKIYKRVKQADIARALRISQSTIYLTMIKLIDKKFIIKKRGDKYVFRLNFLLTGYLKVSEVELNHDGLVRVAKMSLDTISYRVLLYLITVLDDTTFKRIRQSELCEELNILKSRMSKSIKTLTDNNVLIEDPDRRFFYKLGIDILK